MGLTDSGYPLHIVTYNPDGGFNFNNIRKDKRIILINNGIHPGEPDGIDATMLLIRNLAQKQLEAPKNTVIVANSMYTILVALLIATAPLELIKMDLKNMDLEEMRAIMT